ESSNAVLLRGDAALVDTVRGVVEDLDRRAESSGDVRVVRLQHASAEDLLPVLQQVVGSPEAALRGQYPGPGGALPIAAGRLSDPGSATPGQDAPSTGLPLQPQAGGHAPLAASVMVAPGRHATIARYPGAN